ncbi:hypothetical protein FRC17_005072 [Serendipita sp. 399]|nr:hypothetical protein FRC17_005072 [Serendipita sp. 399]
MSRKKTVKTIPNHKKLHKDPGIPKLIAMKAKAEIAAYKPRGAPQRKPGPMATTEMDVTPSISILAAKAAEAEEEAKEVDDGPPELRAVRIQRRQYLKVLHKVVEQSDVVLMVLDARDPEGCRSKMVEDEVRRRESDGKHLIFVLNKIDLVPKENAQAWLKYFRHSAPTIPFKSSTQIQRHNLTSRTSPALLNLLKSFKPPNRTINVGVVGYPNVGKSSLINSLKRARVCPVASEPGWTKDLQSVSIERGLKIIDSPGVIFDEDIPSSSTPSDSISQASRILLLNVLSASSIPDPILIINSILARTPHEVLRELYSLPDFDVDQNDTKISGNEMNVVTKFLTMLALTSGRLLPGGTPNLEAAATQVLRDWNSGKIPYYTPVPEVHPSLKPSETPGAENVGDTKVVDGWKPAFDLGDLWDQGDAQAGENDEDQDMDEEEAEMEEDDSLPSVPLKRLTSDREKEEESAFDPSLGTDGSNVQPTQDQSQPSHQSKRLKKIATYEMELDEHEVSTMATANPMSRKKLRKEAKKGRKFHLRRAREETSFLQGTEMDGLSLQT